MTVDRLHTSFVAYFCKILFTLIRLKNSREVGVGDNCTCLHMIMKDM